MEIVRVVYAAYAESSIMCYQCVVIVLQWRGFGKTAVENQDLNRVR